MRNGVITRDLAAQRAASEVLMHKNAGAVDAVLAGLLAGATRASAASLLGSAGVLVAGTGVGLHFIEGRPRAPGLGEKRPKTPGAPRAVWGATVPRLLECVLATHARFGQVPLGALVGEVRGALRDTDPDEDTKARMTWLEELPRTGPAALEHSGALRGIWQAAGPFGGGLFTRQDLEPKAAEVIALEGTRTAGHEVIIPPEIPRQGDPSPPPPLTVAVETLIAMDRHGVVACGVWAIAPECVAVPGVEGLSLAGFVKAPERGVPRWRPGSTLPLAMPVAVIREQGRVWAGVGVSGLGELENARDAMIRARLEGSSMDTFPSGTAGYSVLNAQAHWVFADASGDLVRTLHIAC